MILYVLIAFVVYLVLSTVLFPNIGHTQQITKTDYSTFVKALDKKSVDKVEYNTDDYSIYYTKKGEDENIAYKTTGVPNDAGFTDRVLESGASLESVVPDKNSGLMTYYLLTLILPMAIFFLIGWWLNRRMKKAMGDDGPSMNFGGGGFGGGGLGKSGARVIASKDVGVTFKDVAGQEEAKESLKEVVDFLEKPQRYEEIGAKLPRGALLVGPPGTGKTLLAKAVAGEAGVPFFSISGSEFVEMFVGRGAAKVRDLFKQAKEKAPCIVFIDEIDTIGKKRDGGGFSGNDEREQTLNQLLTEMDGFDNHKGIVVLAATNRPDSLDPALLRPGRFDRRIPVELPDLTGRKNILELHAKSVKTQPPIDLTAIARATPGASGADLANIINEGALRAVREGRKRATQDDFEESVEVVIAGQQRKSTVLSDHEKQVVSYHEIGHALVAAMQTLCGAAGFTEMYMMDFKREAILMCHQGEGNWRLCRADRRPYLKNRVLSEGGLSNPPTPIFTPEPGRACILSLTHLTADRFRLVCAPGEILPDADLLHVDMPYLFFRPDSGVRSCVTAWLEQGGTHHEALVLGDRLDRIRLFCRLWNVEFVQL